MILNGGELDGKRIISKDAIEEMTQIQTGDLVTAMQLFFQTVEEAGIVAGVSSSDRVRRFRIGQKTADAGN